MTRPESCGPHACGTRQAYELDGCRKDGCRLMMVIWTKDDPPAEIVSGVKRSAEPYGRIIRVLLRDGYTLRELARRADHSAPALRDIALGVTRWIYPSTARAIERLVETLPSEVSA